jgi:hypothetical protein
MEMDSETDGKLRGFMYVERCHLHRLWSYKSIKEEIKILHHKLLRIHKAIRKYDIFTSEGEEDADSNVFNYGITHSEGAQSSDEKPLINEENGADGLKVSSFEN